MRDALKLAVWTYLRGVFIVALGLLMLSWFFFCIHVMFDVFYVCGLTRELVPHEGDRSIVWHVASLPLLLSPLFLVVGIWSKDYFEKEKR